MKNKSNKASAAAVCFVQAAVEGKAETDCGEAECTGSGKSLLESVSSNQRSSFLRPIKQTGGGQRRENKQHEAAGAPCHVVWRKSRLPFPPSCGPAISRRTQFLLGCCCFFMARNGRQNLLPPSASCTPHE